MCSSALFNFLPAQLCLSSLRGPGRSQGPELTPLHGWGPQMPRPRAYTLRLPVVLISRETAIVSVEGRCVVW